MIWALFALLSALLTGISAAVEKKTLLKEHAMEFSAVLAIFNFLISLPLLLKADFSIPGNIWLAIILASFLGAIAFLLFAKALRHSEVSTSSSLMNFRPLFVFFLAFIFLKERLGPLQVIGMLLLIIGAYVLEMRKRKKSLSAPFLAIVRSKAAHYIFLSISIYAVTSIIDKFVLTHISPATYIFLAHAFIAFFFVIFITVFHDGLRGIGHGVRNAWKTIALVALLTTSYRFLQAEAVSMADVSLVSPIKHTSALFATLIGGSMFHEHKLGQKLLAAAIMVVGAVLLIL